MILNGLRIGETLGLKWKDIDFEKRTINIQRALTYNVNINDEGEVIERKKCIGDTKTAGSVRLNLMCDSLYEELKIHYDRQKKLSESIGKNLIDPNSFIFCFNDGSLRTYSSVRSRLNRFLKSNNLENYKIHPHTLRHTFSNSLMENKLNPKIVQRLLGHKSVSTTLKIYNSIDDDMLNESVILLNKLYKKEH